ncbi:hypothetical protein [Streptomyces antimicrobicus]|uniref:Tetratricopeptide repeat protein n=1 Tax=Streptomyces antimicrobicus TaxID=2883108 RepID=A0ABS8BBG2_9ACTN|nr:hypothetical protein [Streptomyces antimicrobicus]MCB5181950.1 hypothetical protein [Streptomyces antimicrobicus]
MSDRPARPAGSADPVYLPWGTVTDRFWARGAYGVGGRLAAIAATAEAGEVARAAAQAEALDGEVSRAHGEQHPALVDIREVRGYLAHLTGQHTAAVRWYLVAVRLRAELTGPTHPQTALAVRRTFSLWRSIPGGEALTLAAELLTTVIAVEGPRSRTVRHIGGQLLALSEPGRISTHPSA